MSHSNSAPVIMALFPLFFLGMWLGISWLISCSGWQDLARHFRAPQEYPLSPTQTRRFQSLVIRREGSFFFRANYNSVLTLRLGPQGLGIAVIFLFRFQHPPLLIPWSAIGTVFSETAFFGLVQYQRVLVELPGEEKRVELTFRGQALATAIGQYHLAGREA